MNVDFGLLKSTIESMRWFYLRISILVLLFLTLVGTPYIGFVLKNYSGDKTEAYIAWAILCIINTYNLYTFYYDSLLVGRGLVKQSKKIIVFSQIIFLILAAFLLKMGFGIISIVASQLIYVLIARSLSKRVFFDKDINLKLKTADDIRKNEVFKAVYPNAIKLGLTSLGGILVQRSAIFIGSLYMPLSDIASYGLTRQIFDLLSGLAPIFISTYYPLIANYRIEGNTKGIRDIYLKGTLLSFLLFIPSAIIIYLYGNSILQIIGSGTLLVKREIIIAAAILSFIEMNHMAAAGILLTKNQVPFFKPSLISGVATAILMLIFLEYTEIGLIGLFLAPGIVDVAYQSWKWPLDVKIELGITFKSVIDIIHNLLKRVFNI
jgi:O-antigen/teichoic acid export membrane protein